MKITWTNIIKLAERMWEINQNELSTYLGKSPSSISRLINGEYSSLRLNHHEIYERLFDPTIAKSHSRSEDPKKLLKDLEGVIDEFGFADATKNLPKDDYKKFVLGLFKLADKNLADENKLKQSQRKKVSPSITKDNKSGGTETRFITSENNEGNNINQENSQNTFYGAQLAIPQDCNICLFCENWKGNTREALESASGAYGRCTHLKKDMLSKEFKCEGFIEKWGLITKYLYSHHDKSKL